MVSSRERPLHSREYWSNAFRTDKVVYTMAKFDVVVVLLQLPLIVLLLHWHAASASAAATSVVTTRGRRSLDSSQLTGGGEFGGRGHAPAPVVRVQAPAPAPGIRVRTPVPAPGVRVHAPAPAPGPSRTHSLNSERDTQMSPDHAPPSPSPSPSLSPPPPPPPPPPPQEPALCKYEVKTQTGTQWTAGTDSTISVRFSNKTEDSIYMVLTQGGLATGHLDVFQIQGRCIHDICKMELYTDASGSLPSWYVEWVAVFVSTPIVTNEHDWPVKEWLPAHEWSSAGSLVRDDCYKY